MGAVCCYFQVHQPYRLRRFSVFDRAAHYFDDATNVDVLLRVAQKCYVPAGRTLLDMIRRTDGGFRCAFSLSGVVVEQMERYSPAALDVFRALVQSGSVELLAETYYHSLSFLYSREEWQEQVTAHRKLMQRVFGVTPTTFRNTELMYNNDVARAAREAGYRLVLAEGVDSILAGRNPLALFHPPGAAETGLLLRHRELSDDVAFRFSNRDWSEWPLTADRFAAKLRETVADGSVVNLFMDFETFGEHQWADTGILEFLAHLGPEALKVGLEFLTPAECRRSLDAHQAYDAPHMTSWADTERDLSAWLGNPMQANALHELYNIENAVKESADPSLLHDWRRLQTSDHYYYMSTKSFNDGQVHAYFNPYDSPYDAYINFMNVIDHLRARFGGPAPMAKPLR